MRTLKKVSIYTDGACSGNPGQGGYGVVLICGENRKELSAGYRRTTNNRMELLAAITGLKALKYPCEVTIFSDSKYLVENYTQGYVFRWQKDNWMRGAKKKEPVKNSDLWQELLQLCKAHKVNFVWVKGHASNAENNRCDNLAVAASQGANLLVDEQFEACGA